MSLRYAAVGLLVAVLALAGCTIRPVYSGPEIDRMAWAFQYDEPGNRLAMVIRDELSIHFAPSKDPSAPHLRISTRQETRGLTRSRNPSTRGNSEMRVIATVTVYNASGIIFTARRFADASYQTNGQVFADQEAAIEAAERAAKEAAQSLRLALLANFSKFQTTLSETP